MRHVDSNRFVREFPDVVALPVLPDPLREEPIEGMLIAGKGIGPTISAFTSATSWNGLNWALP